MTNMTDNLEIFPLSVVIATLGGDTLRVTIEHLDSGPRIPAEILICIPEEESHRVESLSSKNIKVIKTPCRGQVAQRAYGLGRIQQPLVMQMDDDTVLRSDDLIGLMQALEKVGKGNAIAPVYKHVETGRYITQIHRGAAGWVESLYAWLICGAPWGMRRMGVISPAGIGYGVDPERCGTRLFETEWLPGACVLCYREDLFAENYYPFPGKAFTEDLVHSILWRKQGVRLWVEPKVICSMPATAMPFSWKTMADVAKAHRYVVKLMGGKAWRLRLWQVTSLSKNLLMVGIKYLPIKRRYD